MRVYRIQDREGRGPYRPGTSHLWCDHEHEARNPPMMEQFPDILAKMDDLARKGPIAFGCAFRSLTDGRRWFSVSERVRLFQLKYALVALDADVILAESEHQLVFARRRPLRLGAITLPWSALAAQEHGISA